MFKKAAICFLILCLGVAWAQTWQPSWESLDKRPTPQWWLDAKFGIFIHWGVYSVPAFSKVGQYSEWYWHSLVQGQKEYVDFHRNNYGPGFQYADFVPMFKAELFNPDQWADLFERSGAKYVVLTSKHHEGYTLWQNEQANRSWGRPWNAVETGPCRDLLGDLTTAVRKTSVKMGIYYSLYEWYNPIYHSDVNAFVEQHLFPQFKDVVNKYAPAVIFSDGEWDHPSSTWRSEELLSWLFNESPCKDEVVIDDRWGKDTRHKHGGYYTTEYGSGLADASHPWEECRGIAHSFGYSRMETPDDYQSDQSLLLMLIDIVSRGGNFLLDIGPTADGRIPDIMQERLLRMGSWLKVNGEAIYGAATWKKSCQWSKGKVQEAERGEYKKKYDIIELTVAPKPGMAHKELFFTRKGDTVYAIAPDYPDDQLVIRDVKPSSSTKIRLLGHDKDLKWRLKKGEIVVSLPNLMSTPLRHQHAFAFRITQVAE
ncbi:MAG TPA: alpha-L-fucosidase [bacterium]|nr:alpha-L-fucosidase [bacterium]